jgi:AraC-like DNA-binding protein
MKFFASDSFEVIDSPNLSLPKCKLCWYDQRTAFGILAFGAEKFLAKIAVEFDQQRARGEVLRNPARYLLAGGHGWTVSDVICRAGPNDRAFEEQHSQVCIAVVISGSFQYQSTSGRELMTPGSLLLGNVGQYFRCSHEHGVGDRCVSFTFEPQYLESLAAEAGIETRTLRLPLRLPPVRELSSVIARVCAGVAAVGAVRRPNRSTSSAEWEEIGLELTRRTFELAHEVRPKAWTSPAAEARITRVIRMIEAHPESEHKISTLAREAGLSRFHFLRLFQHLTALTPHQYVRRARLRRAATQLTVDQARVLDIALDSGFGDISNFNRAFRQEFNMNPVAHRRLRARDQD